MTRPETDSMSERDDPDRYGTPPKPLHWCELCRGHTGYDSPCYSGNDEPEETDGMTDKQPDALRLADALAYCDASVASQAAAELRGLHAANVYTSDLLTQATDDIRGLRAQVEALTAAARVGLDSGAHIYAGDCPDDTQPEANDPACPACRAIVALSDALKGQA